jgi:hypothetical protein
MFSAAIRDSVIFINITVKAPVALHLHPNSPPASGRAREGAMIFSSSGVAKATMKG